MKLKPYPEYKDSGVEWIGEIPEGWKVSTLKRVSRIETGNTPSKDDERYYSKGDFPWVKPDELDGLNPITTSKTKLNKEGKILARKIPKGSILVCCIGSLGKIGVAGVDLATNQQINSIIPRKNILNPSFAKYLIFSSKTEYQRFSNSNVIGIINKNQQGEIVYVIPLLNEQKQIVNFLDKKTSQIDKTIEKDTKLIELLKEKRTALINHAVTKGLDPDAKMKDSGVEWIGEIPYNWNVKKLKYVSYLIPGQSPHESTYNIEGEGAVLINGPNEYSESDFGYTQSLKWTTAPKKWAPKNSLLFCVRGSTTGRLNIAHSNISIGRGVAAIVAKNDQKFLNYEMIALRPYVLGNSRGSTFPSVTSDDLGNYPVTEPDPIEQLKISEYLDRSTSNIDKTIQKIERKIELLEEYKKSLIHHVVTGKVDVREEVV